MIRDAGVIVQTILGSLLTWGLTALGASLVFLFHSGNKKLLDGSLGFAAGVMVAATFWSLLSPAIEMAEVVYGRFSFVPVAVGFSLGAAFVYMADQLLPHDFFTDTTQVNPEEPVYLKSETKENGFVNGNYIKQRRKEKKVNPTAPPNNEIVETKEMAMLSWKRVFLLIVAITVHNIPEGLAVGVGFGAIGKSTSATFESARNLALGIGIQNFPEGLAVSLPLAGLGYSKWKSFWYGQLSGMVEPIAALLGVVCVTLMEPILPGALSFAAGAMIFVVFDDIIPEAQQHGHGKFASVCGVIGFIVMMSLDVGLG